ncbi:TetR family transcriptional regulator [Pseudonocardiaceae bacterium YIM PH 21723]|nr:TetR family transcriptional regulator [Pseudonocardiaceae bacterium YIM PH 21723]
MAGRLATATCSDQLACLSQDRVSSVMSSPQSFTMRSHRNDNTMRVHCKGGIVPKQVDHAARRRQLAEALWRVTIEHGLEAATLRRVATEAGVSMGMVQHYFASTGDMLSFALASMTEQVSRRIGERFAELTGADPKTRVRAVLLEMLPLDEERHLEASVASAFLARAAVDERIAGYLREGFAEGVAYLGEQLGSERRAKLLLTLVNGLTLAVLAGQLDTQDAVGLLDEQLG